MLGYNTIAQYIGLGVDKVKGVLYPNRQHSVDDLVQSLDVENPERRRFLGYAARVVGGVALTGLLATMGGCAYGGETGNSMPPEVGAQANKEREELIERVYQAHLIQYDAKSDVYYLQLYQDGKESFSVSRTISNPGLSFKDKIIGVWSTGLGTEDFPASYVGYTFLNFSLDNKVEYLEEEGHDVLDKEGKTQYVRDKVIGPFFGQWKITGDSSLEIRLRM